MNVVDDSDRSDVLTVVEIDGVLVQTNPDKAVRKSEVIFRSVEEFKVYRREFD